jgi:hypothetical protein
LCKFTIGSSNIQNAIEWIEELGDEDDHNPHIDINETLITYDKNFKPRPKSLLVNHLWGKAFWKKHYHKVHEKLNLNHVDFQSCSC